MNGKKQLKKKKKMAKGKVQGFKMTTDDKVLIGMGVGFVGVVLFLATKQTSQGRSILAQGFNDVLYKSQNT